jgi:hypothetical protein
MRRNQGWAVLVFLSPMLADAQSLPHIGETRSLKATGMPLDPAIIRDVEYYGGCHQLEAIRIEPIPADFDKEHKYAGWDLELWTVIGCGKEFPVWIGWKEGVAVMGHYKWPPGPEL